MFLNRKAYGVVRSGSSGGQKVQLNAWSDFVNKVACFPKIMPLIVLCINVKKINLLDFNHFM